MLIRTLPSVPRVSRLERFHSTYLEFWFLAIGKSGLGGKGVCLCTTSQLVLLEEKNFRNVGENSTLTDSDTSKQLGGGGGSEKIREGISQTFLYSNPVKFVVVSHS